jgi:hypothetical protein
MNKIIQLRDVPAEVHDALTREAEAAGLSLNRYVIRELANIAKRSEQVHHNRVLLEAAQKRISALDPSAANPQATMAALRELREG